MTRGFFVGWGRPPAWAWVVMIVGALFIAVTLPFALNRGALSADEVERIEAEAAERRAAQPSEEQPARVLVIGDSYTAGSAEGGNGDDGWAALADAGLDDVTIDVSAAGGSGYTQEGQTGEDFTDLAVAAEAPPYDLIVFFGSRNDSPGKGDVQVSASEAFAAAQEHSPDAGLLVIGPPWVDDSPPASVTASRDAVEAAAEQAGATFVDPLDRGWFGDRPELIGSDGVHPTDEGHAYMSRLIGPLIEQELATAS